MTRCDCRAKLLAACLSAMAGYVDAIGFIALGGFFVSFMSGNTTRLAVGLAQHTSTAAVAAGLIALFVAGAVLGAAAWPLLGLAALWIAAAAAAALTAVAARMGPLRSR